MNDIIRKRKSIRKYDLAPLDATTIEKVKMQIGKVTPLYPDIRYSIDIVNITKGLFNIKAPHYLVFRSEVKDGAYENIGFIGQQLDLFFSGSGLGSCWLGAAKPEKENPSAVPVATALPAASALPVVICMSFGKPAEPLHRDISGFKRKSLSEISEGVDERLEAARLAPNATNAQRWYFIAENGKIHCYRVKSNALLGLIYDKLHSVDIGIALCHIALCNATTSGGTVTPDSDGFSFSKEANSPERKGCIYSGTVQSVTGS